MAEDVVYADLNIPEAQLHCSSQLHNFRQCPHWHQLTLKIGVAGYVVLLVAVTVLSALVLQGSSDNGLVSEDASVSDRNESKCITCLENLSHLKKHLCDPEQSSSAAPWSNSKPRNFVIKGLIALTALIIIITLAALLAVEKSKPSLATPTSPAGPCCPEGWIGYRGKCYYFSETEGNWTYSRSQCSSLNASLAAIDSEQEKDFLLLFNNFLDRWVGLHREPGQPWRWLNGTEFDLRFPIRGGGNCVYLIDENWFGSSRCSTWRRWICSKPDAYEMRKKCIT